MLCKIQFYRKEFSETVCECLCKIHFVEFATNTEKVQESSSECLVKTLNANVFKGSSREDEVNLIVLFQ